MALTYGELVEELQERSSEELVDLAVMARRYAIEKRRDEIRKNSEESMREYLAGELPEATDDVDELWRRLEL